MATHIKNRFLLPALTAGLGLILAGRGTAQTFTTLHNFTARNTVADGEGANPLAGLILSGNTLYGTASGGTTLPANETVFKVNTDGTGFTTLHNFTPPSASFPYSDGLNPYASVILSGNTLYGTAFGGGGSGSGTVFKVNTDGTGFTTLYRFTPNLAPGHTNSDGAAPRAGLILSGNTLYGTAEYGGGSGRGTVFKVNTDGTGFTTLHSFTAISAASHANGDGANPYAGLILLGDTLYGTAKVGGSSGNGTVFKLNTNGTGFTTLHGFTATSAPSHTNSDGAAPYAGLLLSGNVLYGTAGGGGNSGNGTVFKVNTDGTGFTTLYSFTAISGGTSTNSDGAEPHGSLILAENTLYGTALHGGSSGNGTVFKINTDGTGFTTLYDFTGPYANRPMTNSDGADPFAGLILSDNTLYGTAWAGGSSGNGTVFSLLLRRN
jgi:uncharacterized repeat protein (TIGR03803 family)